MANQTCEVPRELLSTIASMLVGIRIKEGKTTWYSQLDNCIDQLGVILGWRKEGEGD